jgi:hypothetical protein
MEAAYVDFGRVECRRVRVGRMRTQAIVDECCFSGAVLTWR